MQLINRSSFPTKFIKNLIKQYSSLQLINSIKKVIVITNKELAMDGTYCPITDTITISIGDSNLFPCFRTSRNCTKYGYLRLLLRDSKEALLFVLFHELRHLFQNKLSKRQWFSGKFKLFSWGGMKLYPRAERDADRYAKRKLDKWRKIGLDSSK